MLLMGVCRGLSGFGLIVDSDSELRAWWMDDELIEWIEGGAFLRVFVSDFLLHHWSLWVDLIVWVVNRGSMVQ